MRTSKELRLLIDRKEGQLKQKYFIERMIKHLSDLDSKELTEDELNSLCVMEDIPINHKYRKELLATAISSRDVAKRSFTIDTKSVVAGKAFRKEKDDMNDWLDEWASGYIFRYSIKDGQYKVKNVETGEQFPITHGDVLLVYADGEVDVLRGAYNE